MPTSSAPASRPSRHLWAIIVDVVAVIIFAAIGRSAHSRAPGIDGLIQTAWPFVVALLVGWTLWLLLRRGSALSLGVGVWMWLVTMIGGMTIWGVRDAKIPHFTFIAVACLATLILLLGWRLIAGALLRRRTA